MNFNVRISKKDDDIKIITSVLDSFWIKSSEHVNYILSKNNDNFLDWEDEEKLIDWDYYSWEDVVLKWLNYDNDSLWLINMNPLLSLKFYLIYFSNININNLNESYINKIISQIVNNNVSESDFRKILNFISNDKDSCIQEDSKNVNNEWWLAINNLSPFMLDNFSFFPRVIKLENWSLISIQKSSELPNWKKIFTIRFWIKKENVAFPIYTWICNLIIWNWTFTFTKVLWVKWKLNFIDDLNELKLFFSKFYTENNNIKLNEIKKWKTWLIWDISINFINKLKGWFYKAQIFDAWLNDKWHKVLLIQSVDNNDSIFAQLEMNLFSQNWKNIIYIWSLWKDENREKFIKAVPWLLTRLRDILKEFSSDWELEVWSVKADMKWIETTMRRDNISQAIKRYKPKK